MLTPLATNGSTTFAAVNDLAVPQTANGLGESATAFYASVEKARGEMVAVDQNTGKLEWDDKLPSSPDGAAAVTNNLVFTTTFDWPPVRVQCQHRRDPVEHTTVCRDQQRGHHRR